MYIHTLEYSGEYNTWLIDLECKMQVREALWNPTPEVKAHRLCRYTVPIDAQENYESEK